MSDARTRILQRVRAAERTGYVPAVDRSSFDKLRMSGTPLDKPRMSGTPLDKPRMSGTPLDELRMSGTPLDKPRMSESPLALSSSKGELLARFLSELTALGVEHHVEPTADAVRARVREIVAGQPVFRWDVDRLPYGVGDLLTNAADGATPRDLQASAAIGVTGCDAAIAETGSLAMITGRGKPRATSLLPPTHLAIVRTDQLRATMGELFEERAAELSDAANCTFITGASRTADIELTLTVGVHGPGRVVVIIGP